MNSKRSMTLFVVFLVALTLMMVGPARADDGFEIDSVVISDVYGNVPEPLEFDVYEPVMIDVNYIIDEEIVPCKVKVIIKAFRQRHTTTQKLYSAGSYTVTDTLVPLKPGERKIRCILKVWSGGGYLGKDVVIVTINEHPEPL